MSDTRIAIFASGSGSTAEAFLRSVYAQKYPLQSTLIVTNNPNALVLQRAEQLNAELGLGLVTAVVNSHTQAAAHPIIRGEQTEEEQRAIVSLLAQHRTDLVLLLGYMKRIGQTILEPYGWLPHYTSVYQARMLNTHPGLLPATVGTHGRGTQEFTLTQGMAEAGQTLHAVAAEYDTGPTVAEHRVPVQPNDTPDSLFARVQAAEKQYLAADVMAFVTAQKEYQNSHE